MYVQLSEMQTIQVQFLFIYTLFVYSTLGLPFLGKDCGYFNQILKGEKTIEYRDLKPSTMNRFTWVDT